ncbi:MAG: PAS domain S-box protein [Phycisphaerae bacterium]
MPPTPPVGSAASHAGNAPGRDLLASLYQHLPVLVIHMTTDGTVLHCNPETVRVTGYAEAELVGKNFWGVLFPGRLFAQVPKFISAIHPVQALAKDVAMTLRAKDGQERTVAFSRFVHDGAAGPGGGHGGEGMRSMVCIGNDLTDRLLESDKGHLNALPGDAVEGPGVIAGAAEGVEGEVVTPLAITPAPMGGEHAAAAIQQVHEFLSEVEGRVAALEKAFSDGELTSIALIAEGLHNGAHACGLLTFSTRAEQLRSAAMQGAAKEVVGLVNESVGLCRAGKV